MPNSSKQHSAKLTLIKGGKISGKEFAKRPFPEKLTTLRELPAVKRMELILADPEAHKLTRAFQPQELFWMVNEIGLTDALELLELSSPEQFTFFLDTELWEKWSFSQVKALEWLGYLAEAGEARVLDQLSHIDFELLILIFMKEVTVGGGIGELATDDERLADWDHSFDNIYFISFKSPQHYRLIATLLDIVFRNDHPLYLALMEGIRNEPQSELEELCYQLRSGRLADLGFPEFEEALSIYARVDPAAFVPGEEKKLVPFGGEESLPVPLLTGDSLLQRALARAGSEELFLELNYLINSALVAEETALADNEVMQAVFQRVYGCLNIALEYLTGGNEEKAAGVLTEEYLKRLFQLGYSVIIGLKRTAEKLNSDNYAINKALLGLKAKRPMFYRGLDPDGIDGYREFREMEDVRKVEEFLRTLEDLCGQV
ncbi:MAG: hypothetical protein FD174_651 [Geobacteraceae bacterium]|nr:MAG: hypothetical protein FD174_651 [Geobacteraceae bacterium]